MERTAVTFYKEKDNAILAVFEQDLERPGVVSCYSHAGQHSQATIGYVITLKRATKKEYASLKAELEGNPYNYKLNVL